MLRRSAASCGATVLPRGEYKPASAVRIALSRRRRLSKIERLSRLRYHVSDHLAMGWSPEQIAGRLRLEGSEHEISHESIYRFIYRPKVRQEKLHRFLARAKATRGRRTFKRRREPIPGRVMRWIVGGYAVTKQAASSSQMGRFETEVLATEENLAALADLTGQWIDSVHGRRLPTRIILDMDSSVSPTHGDQEGTA